jgi:hypothetical protein
MPKPLVLFQKKDSKDGLSTSQQLNFTNHSDETLDDASSKSPFERAAQKVKGGIGSAKSKIPSPSSKTNMTKM